MIMKEPMVDAEDHHSKKHHAKDPHSEEHHAKGPHHLKEHHAKDHQSNEHHHPKELHAKENRAEDDPAKEHHSKKHDHAKDHHHARDRHARDHYGTKHHAKEHSKRRAVDGDHTALASSGPTSESWAGPWDSWESWAGPWDSWESWAGPWDSWGMDGAEGARKGKRESTKLESMESSRRSQQLLSQGAFEIEGPKDASVEYSGGMEKSRLQASVPLYRGSQRKSGDAKSQEAYQSQKRTPPSQPSVAQSGRIYGNRTSTDDYRETVEGVSITEAPQIAAIGMMTTDAQRDLELGKLQLLDRHDDPFAPREGKTLTWRNVNMTLAAKGDKPEHKILQEIWGEVPKRQTTAVMGPSGSGKTCLLNVLSGRVKTGGKITVQADVRLDNFIVDPTNIKVRKQIAFVAQDDSLQVAATPAESIRFSAKLRLARSTTDEELEALTTRMLEELGLTHCANTVVGGSLLKGISGGERKRTSVGVELVVKPALVFLDEPSSGLDSFSALQLCNVLKKVANAGASVLFTIHQPASDIFNAFDHMILLNKGRVMYQGHVADVPAYFAARDYPLPPNYNPADWIMNVAQLHHVKELECAGFFPKDECTLGEAIKGDEVEGKDVLGNDIVGSRASSAHLSKDDRHVSQLTEFIWLMRREGNSMKRDKTFLVARFMQATFMSVLIGIIFLNVGKSDPAKPINLQSNFGAQIITLFMSIMGTALPTLLVFPQERPVFLREYSTDHYSPLAYVMSRLGIEAFVTGIQIFVTAIITYYLIGFQCGFGWYYLLLFVLAMSSTALAVLVGSAIEDPKMGLEFLPLLFFPQALFAGFFVSPELIPVWLRWIQYLCALMYGTRLRLFYEFGGGCGSEAADFTCSSLLDSLNVSGDDVWWYWVVLVALFVVFRLMGLFVLSRKASKFY